MSTTEIVQPDGLDVIKEAPERGRYAAVRYNALKHGLLSKQVVLPHEDRDEFENLLAALMSEHSPSGATEMLLVEELAGIIWRKRRVLFAEGAKINRGLRGSLVGLDKSSSATVRNAVPGDSVLASAHVDFRDLMTMTADEVETRKHEVIRDMETTDHADQIVRRNSKTAYAKALKTLQPCFQEWWEELLEEGEVEATADDLQKFIQNEILSGCRAQLAVIYHHDAIKQQVIGEGVDVPIMERLSRYETHLDRKFQRTLAMLIKLKELGGKQ